MKSTFFGLKFCFRDTLNPLVIRTYLFIKYLLTGFVKLNDPLTTIVFFLYDFKAYSLHKFDKK